MSETTGAGWTPYSTSVVPVISFNYTAWAAQFPEFASTVSSAQATAYSLIAAGYIDLSASSPMGNNLPVMAQVWNFVTAHIAQIFSGSSIQPVSPLIGRIDSASEGSVSVHVSMPADTSQLAGWFGQTKYGSAAWAMMAQFRVGFYAGACGVSPSYCGLVPNYYPFAGAYGLPV